MNQSVKEKMSGFHPVALAALRFIIAVLAFIVFCIYMFKAFGPTLEYISSDYVLYAIAGIVLVSIIPLTVVAFNIAWGASFIRSKSPYDTGFGLQASSAASVAVSYMFAFFSLAMTLVVGAALSLVDSARSAYSSSSSYLSYADSSVSDQLDSATFKLVLLLIFLILGTVSQFITPALRKAFYSSINKANCNQGEINTGVCSGYGAMKIVNLVVRSGFIFVILAFVFDLDGSGFHLPEDIESTAVIILVLTVIAIVCGIIACIIEAAYAFGMGNAGRGAQFAGPSPYNNDNYNMNNSNNYNQPYNQQPDYNAPYNYNDSYNGAQSNYSAPQPDYSAPQYDYSAPQTDYSAPQPEYSDPQPEYSAPQPEDDFAQDIPQAASFCTQCGAEIKPGSGFCTQCGAKVE